MKKEPEVRHVNDQGLIDAVIARAHAQMREARDIIDAVTNGHGPIEFGWVIERGDSDPGAPTYWAGVDRWSQDGCHAIRFARKQDAERVAASLSYSPNCRIAEHGWG